MAETTTGLRIALVTRAFSWASAGGGEVLVRLLANELSRLGHDVHVLAVDARGTPEEAPFRVWPLESLATLEVRRVLREVRPDVIDAHNMESMTAAILAGKSLRIPVVVTVNSAYPACLFSDLYRPGHGVCETCSITGVRDCFTKRPAAQIGRRVPAVAGYAEVRRRLALLKRADRVIAHSHASENVLTRNGIPDELVRVVPNFDEPAFHQAHTPIDERILFVGALTFTKGPDTLIKAFARLAPRRRRARLQLAGTGYYREDLERLAEELGVADRIDFLGYVPHEEVAQRYREAGVVVFPSRAEEAFGRVIFEAWGAGAPLVATRLSAPGEIVRDGETGLLVDPDDPDEMADAIERVLADPDLAQRLTAAGRDALAAYAPAAVVPRFVDVYREAMA